MNWINIKYSKKSYVSFKLYRIGLFTKTIYLWPAYSRLASCSIKKAGHLLLNSAMKGISWTTSYRQRANVFSIFSFITWWLFRFLDLRYQFHSLGNGGSFTIRASATSSNCAEVGYPVVYFIILEAKACKMSDLTLKLGFSRLNSARNSWFAFDSCIFTLWEKGGIGKLCGQPWHLSNKVEDEVEVEVVDSEDESMSVSAEESSTPWKHMAHGWLLTWYNHSYCSFLLDIFCWS